MLGLGGGTARRLRSSIIVLSQPAVCSAYDLRPGNPPECQLDGAEGDDGSQGFGKVFEILGKTPVSSEPREGASDSLAAWQDDEAVHVVPRLTISVRSRGTFATAAPTCQAL